MGLDSVPDCWICGDEGDTGEHLIKKSDLLSYFGIPSQNSPLFLSNHKKKNVRIGSFNNDRLKSPARICAKCNNQRTQPYDKAWENLSYALKNCTPPIGPRSIFRANEHTAFPCDTQAFMRRVHLYFVKLFGCHIVTGDIPIDITGFSKAILKKSFHPKVFLKFGINNPCSVGMSDVCTQQVNGSCVFATWFYEIGSIAVNVMYSDDGIERNGLEDSWHPNLRTSELLISNFKE